MNNPKTRRDFLRTVASIGAGLALTDPLRASAAAAGSTTPAAGGGPPATGPGVVGLKVPPLDRVRIGFIGLGVRGSAHLGQFLTLDGVDIAALCDNHAPSLDAALAVVAKAGRPVPPAFGNGDEDYKRMLERKDIDIVIIATPWELHTPMALAALLSGKHAFIEVPAAITVEQCWALVDTAERTQRHCMMLENSCYGREELLCLHLCRLGVLGELIHGEGSYIHDLRFQMEDVDHGTGSWRTLHYARRNGNLYPTHGLGPLAQYFGINRGDRFEYLSSVSSPARARALYTNAHYPPPHKWSKIPRWTCGDMNTSIIKTALGRTIMLQWDENSPRPYTRLNHIQGTRGTFASFPNRLVIEGETPNTHEWVTDDKLTPYLEKYEHPLWKRMGTMAEAAGGHGGMDFLIRWRIIHCLRSGEPLDQDVYDGVTWSVIAPLTEWSVANRSQPIDVPDFTRGRWQTTPLPPIVT